MVEKVFISPNRVRAYGNIVNMKTGDDFTLVNSELTVTTDTVNGAEMTVFSMEVAPHISVSATNPYMLSGETTDIVVKLEKGLGKPLTNKNVTIEQSIFRDNGTTASHNDDWVKYNPDNITITRGEEYTSVTGSNYRYGVPISNNCKIKVETRKPTVSTGTLLSIWGYSTNPLSASQLLLFSVTELGMTQGTFANLEMTVTPTTVTVKNLDNDTTITKEYSTTYNLLMNFWGTTFDYKNFKVYETINGVTDERGEFALNDVNVTDDTTFTATYDTVSDSVDVFLCTSYDYGTSNKNTNMWTLSNFTLSRGDSYSTLMEGSSTGTCTSDSNHKISPTQTLEFDICQVDGTKYYAPIYIRNDGGGTSLASIQYSELNANVGEWVHVKIVFNNTSTITIYADTLAEPITKTLSATSTNYRLMFYGNSAITTLYFKNVAIY